MPAPEDGAQTRCALPSAPIPCSQPPNLLLCSWHNNLSQQNPARKSSIPWAPLARPQHGRWGPLGLQICLFDHKRAGTPQPRQEDGKGKAELFIVEHQDLSLNSGLISLRPD